MSTGFALASFSTAVWHLLLTQGMLTGLGMSLVYFPLLAPVPEYFAGRRGLAMGFVSFCFSIPPLFPLFWFLVFSPRRLSVRPSSVVWAEFDHVVLMFIVSSSKGVGPMLMSMLT